MTYDDTDPDAEKVAYGPGTTQVNLRGGVVHNAFGSSNTKGNVRVSSNVHIDQRDPDDPEYCAIDLDEIYGGGNNALYNTPRGKTGPTINVRSFTSIGTIFGGGRGENAKVTGNTNVEIGQ